MRIRKLRSGDIGEIVRLIHSVMGPQDARKVYTDLKISLAIGKDSPYKFEDFFVAEIDGKLVAAGGFWALKYEPAVAHLDWFVVDPACQRKGIGSMLFRYCEKEMKKRGVKMLTAETEGGKLYKAVVAFYLHNGFRIVAEIPKYWEDGSSWVYFFKRLE